jgi:hypothetical protein
MAIKLTDEELVKYVVTARDRAKTFRDNYQEEIDDCIDHYNCTHPSEWSKKEDWQSKIFMPMAFKNVEVGASMLTKMLFSQKDFFEITGFDPEENDQRDALKDFIVHVLQKGNFYNIGALAIKEACITSTCFLKTIDVSKNKKDFTLNFIPRTFHDIYVDPSVAFYWINTRFVVDEYERDISDIITNKIYKYGEKYFEDIKKFTAAEKSFSGEQRKALENISDNGADETYKPHVLTEFHGKVKDPETQEDVEMILTVCDDKWLIRKDEVDEDDRPYDAIRVNPIPKQFYGAGLIRKNIDIEKLMNGVINLWFDNWKLSVMKIIGVDPAGNVKWETIKIEPAAIWEAAKNALYPIEFGVPVNGVDVLGVLDQISQEVTGITKTAQGQSSPSADETLGEVQLKLSRSDDRFMQMAKFIEAEFIGRFIKKVINYTIKNCPQEYVDKIMGYRKVTRKVPIPLVGEILQGAQNFINQVFKVKRLDLDYIREHYKGDFALDFQPIGISRFANKSDELARYRELLQAVLANPQLAAMFDLKKLVKQTMRAMGFDDISDLMKTEEEIDEAMAPKPQQPTTPDMGAAMGGVMPPMPMNQPLMGGMGGA